MHFVPLLSLLGLAASASATIGASQMVSNIDQITELSSSTNDIAQSISVVNVFSTGPQLINNFKDIIQTATNDITAMNTKRSIHARQECLDVTDIERCIQDLGEIVDDPSEILGSKRFVKVEKKRQDAPAYSDTEQQAVCTAFREFVMIHQELLKTVIGKHGLLSLTPFTKPIAAVLQTLEGGVDELAFGIIDSVPTCAQDATQNKNSLDSTLRDARDKYDQ
ncbi:unnamed protein product [Penicillium manginii]